MNLTKKDIIDLHRIIQKRYRTTPGIRQEGVLDSIIERHELRLYGKELYPNIYLKSASIMEGIIRLHPFIDGNKRTGLIATQTYLEINGYLPIFPIHAVRFSVIIAKTKAITHDEEQTTTDNLIKEISEWLRKYVVKNDEKNKAYQIILDIEREIAEVERMLKYNPIQAQKIMDEWLAIDIYPEYKRDALEMIEFIKVINQLSTYHLKIK